MAMNTRCKFHYKSEHYFVSFARDNSQETVFTDGFESMANWDRSENSFGHSISALDSSKKRSGTYSGRIDDNYPTNGEKYVYSDTWTSITNSNDTFYTVAAWVYVENVADNSAEIYLATRKAGETGYPSGHYVSDKITQKGQWVYVEKSISVPADVRQLNVRIDNNKDGKVWFDDVTIVKGNTSKTLIVEESNYYPFGLEHKGYNNVVSSNSNSVASKFKYANKEHEEELGLNTIAYGWRDYDPAIARFNKIDRFAEKYDPVSPYAFTANNPMLYKEIAGDSTYVVIYGAGYLKPSYKGKRYDVGSGFKKSAEAKAKEIKSRKGYDAKRDQVVVVGVKTEEEFMDAVNKEYDTGEIAELTTYSHGTNNSINLGGEETDADSQEDKRWVSVSDVSTDTNKRGENEFNQIDSNNFSPNARISLYGCNLAGSKPANAGGSPAQAIVNRIGNGATSQALQGGGGAEFMQRNGRNVYNGKMIRSADRSSQRQRLTKFQAKKTGN
jgi:RHS repeat-associated protein